MVIPVIDTQKTGQRINQLRLDAGLTVKDIQAVMGFETPQAIYKWVHGTSLPNIDNLVILSALLETPIQEIIVVRDSA